MGLFSFLFTDYSVNYRLNRLENVVGHALSVRHDRRKIYEHIDRLSRRLDVLERVQDLSESWETFAHLFDWIPFPQTRAAIANRVTWVDILATTLLFIWLLSSKEFLERIDSRIRSPLRFVSTPFDKEYAKWKRWRCGEIKELFEYCMTIAFLRFLYEGYTKGHSLELVLDALRLYVGVTAIAIYIVPLVAVSALKWPVSKRIIVNRGWQHLFTLPPEEVRAKERGGQFPSRKPAKTPLAVPLSATRQLCRAWMKVHILNKECRARIDVKAPRSIAYADKLPPGSIIEPSPSDLPGTIPRPKRNEDSEVVFNFVTEETLVWGERPKYGQCEQKRNVQLVDGEEPAYDMLIGSDMVDRIEWKTHFVLKTGSGVSANGTHFKDIGEEIVFAVARFQDGTMAPVEVQFPDAVNIVE